MKVKMSGTAYCYIGLILLMIAILIGGPGMPDLESKLLPMIVSSAVLLVSVIGLWREIQPKSKDKTADSRDQSESKFPRETWRGYGLNGAWTVGYLLAIYVLGLYYSTILLTTFYSRWLGTRWRVSFFFAFVVTVVIFLVFEIALDIKVYRGFLPWIVK